MARTLTLTVDASGVLSLSGQSRGTPGKRVDLSVNVRADEDNVNSGPGVGMFLSGAWINGRTWKPVTMHTFDGVVAGRGNGFVLLLLQVGED